MDELIRLTAVGDLIRNGTLNSGYYHIGEIQTNLLQKHIWRNILYYDKYLAHACVHFSSTS